MPGPWTTWLGCRTGESAADLGGEVETVEVGHTDVGDADGGVVSLDGRERPRAVVRRRQHLVAGIHEKAKRSRRGGVSGAAGIQW